MARIAGVNLPTQKRLEIGLTYIYGIGRSTALKICKELGLDPDEKVRDLTDEEVTKLRNYIDSELEVEGDLRRDRAQAMKRLTEIGSYRGIRHRRGLPVGLSPQRPLLPGQHRLEGLLARLLAMVDRRVEQRLGC